MKIWIIAGLIALIVGIIGGYSWAAANAAQKQMPVRMRSTAYCATRGGASLECVLNGKAGVCNETSRSNLERLDRQRGTVDRPAQTVAHTANCDLVNKGELK